MARYLTLIRREQNESGYHLKFQGWVLNPLSDFVGVLEGLQRFAEAGQLQIDAPDGEMHVTRCPTLVTLVVQGVPRVRERSLQTTQAFMGARQVQIRLCTQVWAIRLFGQT
jgi:hypothetical protein